METAERLMVAETGCCTLANPTQRRMSSDVAEDDAIVRLRRICNFAGAVVCVEDLFVTLGRHPQVARVNTAVL